MSPRFQKLPRERREALLEALVAEVAEHGFDDASVASIAQRAGLSKASLFYYFTDRDEMLAEVVRHFYAEALGQGGAVPVRANSAEEFWQTFEALYRGVATRLGASPVRARFVRAWLEVVRRSAAPEALRPYVEQARAVLESVLNAGLECGAVRADLPRPLLFSSLFALALSADAWMADAVLQGMPAERAVDTVLRLLRSAFGAPAPAAKKRSARKSR